MAKTKKSVQDNLIPLNKRAKNVQRQIQSMGGKARAEKIRERKTMREDMETLLSLPFKDKEFANKLNELGFNTDNLNNQNALLVSMYLKAYSMGDTQAFNSIRELIGEKVTEIKVNSNLDDKVQKLNELLK